jgi:outer membrane receptor protein involved in Fe transport
MAEAVIKDMCDLQKNVPGLGAFQNQSATNSSFSIRVVGTSSQNFGLESSVGLYVDGVYRARQNSMINNLVDVAAVEVLCGPQGTLFGKNTPSGAICVGTVAFGQSFRSDVNLGEDILNDRNRWGVAYKPCILLMTM